MICTGRLLCLSLLLSSAMATAEDGAQLRKQRFAASVQVGTAALAGANFEFACHPAADGSLSLSLVLARSDAKAGFPFDAFEGPDGIGGERDLAEWQIDTRGDGLRVSGPIGGWYGVDGDGFIFSRSQPNRRPDALGQFVRAALAPEAKRLRLTVRAPEQGEPLRAELLLEGHQAAIRETIAACLR